MKEKMRESNIGTELAWLVWSAFIVFQVYLLLDLFPLRTISPLIESKATGLKV